MKDQVFTGADVTAAVAAAAGALGVAPADLRYVVLESGGPGIRGGAATSARIAVLLDGSGRGARTQEEAATPQAAPEDPAQGLRRVVQDVARAARVEIDVEIQETGEAVALKLSGDGCAFLMEDEGEALEALEHLLQRAFGRAVAPRRLTVDCAGQRERREDALRQMALGLAEQVRADGVSRTTRPLNSYERRLVHVVIGDQAGLRTFSVGEGADRRVTIALAGPGTGSDEQ